MPDIVPTERELQALKVLWQLERATVREIADAINDRGAELAYTTVLSLLQVMEQKGLVGHTARGKVYTYFAKVDRERTLARLARGFLDRVWRLIVDDKAEELKLNEAVQNVPPTDEQLRTLHKTIKYVTEDVQRLEFNTAIARMMEFTNFFTKQSVRPREIMEKFVLILSPFAPHIAEELWQLLGHDKTLAYEPWP